MAKTDPPWLFIVIGVVLVFVLWLLKLFCRNEETSNGPTGDEQAERAPIVSSPSSRPERDEPASCRYIPRATFTPRPSYPHRSRELGLEIYMDPQHPQYHRSYLTPYLIPETSANSTVPTEADLLMQIMQTLQEPAAHRYSDTPYPFQNPLSRPPRRGVHAVVLHSLPSGTPHPPSSAMYDPPPSYAEANTLSQPATRDARDVAPNPLPNDIPDPSSTIDQPPPSYTEAMDNLQI